MNSAPIWSREIPWAEWVAWTRRHPVGVALGVGVALRLLEWSHDRPYWLDEGSLIGCIRQVDRVGLFGPLGSTQLAPPGFLAAEWLVTHLLGTSTLAYRLVPLIAGIASLFLVRAWVRRFLTPCGTLLAVLLFALTDDLIYFSAEVKQYGVDLALTLLILSRADRVAEGAPLGVRQSGLIALGLTGTILIWCSHPLAFTLAAVGLVGCAGAAARRDGRLLAAWAGVGLAWVASIGAVRAVGMRQLGHRADMWAFWESAFPPWPIASAWDASWPIRRLGFLFVNPLNFDWPLGPRWSVVPAIALAAVGGVRLARREPARLATLLLPGAFALLAAYLRLYPFHGRLLLFLAPLLLIPLAEGLDAVPLRRLRHALIALLVGGLAWTDAGHLGGCRDRLDLNPFGDRRPARLDPTWYPLRPPPVAFPRPAH